jgi:hypothetical protein
MNPGKPTPPFNISELRVTDLEAIEYFAGASEVPNEYSGLNTTCGLLVLHRRRTW